MAFARTGKSNNRVALQAGREAAAQALEGIPRFGSEQPRLLLAFATAGYEQKDILRGIHEVAGDIPVSGCSTSGLITEEGIDETSHAVGILALGGRNLHCETFQADRFSRSATHCANKLTAQINSSIEARHSAPRLLLLFPDGLTGNVAELLETLEHELRIPVKIAGGTASELLKLDRTWQYHDGRASSDAVSAVLMSGDLTAEIAISHGCEPIGLEQTVTRAENGWIYEIDGKPAWSVYRDYLDPKDQNIERLSMEHVCYICLAETLKNPDPDYGFYIIRCPLQLDRRTGGLFFPGNIETGTRVRMALRNPDRTVARAKAVAEKIRSRHPHRQPDAMLHFDCCCRGSLLFGRCASEVIIKPLQDTFGAKFPWFGFSTYGEIAAVKPGETLFHNYTAGLCALYLEQS